MASSSNTSTSGKVLELKSPFGEETMTYKWPLKKGKGSVRRSEVRDGFLKNNPVKMIDYFFHDI